MMTAGWMVFFGVEFEFPPGKIPPFAEAPIPLAPGVPTEGWEYFSSTERDCIGSEVCSFDMIRWLAGG